ncbi:hypothetical protein ACO0SA_001501 [Hanseniaspora valbyensis]
MAKVTKAAAKAQKEKESKKEVETITNEDLQNASSSNEEEKLNSDISELSSSDEGEAFEGFDEGEEEEEEDKEGSHTIKKLDTTEKKTKDSETKSKKENKILYVSRLPQGFEEQELKKYFSQFGDINKCKIAKNKKTNKSRHYGFIKFYNDDDCDAAADSMDNYLLMGHLLRVKVVKGNSISKLRDYKKNIILKEKLKWKNLDKINSENVSKYEQEADSRHAQRLEKLKESGIDFEY